MYYILQENLFKEENFNKLVSYLDKNAIPYEIIKWLPFQEDIEVHTDRKDIICFGGVSLTKAAVKYGWWPGVFYNSNHDMEVYMKWYGDHMLNSDGTVISSEDPLPDNLPDIFFARPTQDTKLFNGGLFSHKGWNENMRAYIDMKKGLESGTRIFVAPDKEYIAKEVRCWVVEGKVVTTSLYKLGILGHQKNYDHEEDAVAFAQSMVDIWYPSRAFVLDICLYQGEWKVVEINCINSAGFYDANMTKLINALENGNFVWEPHAHWLARQPKQYLENS